jgi:hypothetical protein
VSPRPGRLAVALFVFISLCLPLPVTVRAQACVTLEDFSAGKVGALPPGWKLRTDEGRGMYTVQEEGGRRYLHAASQGLGIQAAKEITWDLARYPVLMWSWRPVEFPMGADERDSRTNDSALAVYGVFPHRMASVRSVKYVWSAVVPVGSRLSSSMGLTQVRVLRTGTENEGRWTDERVNLLDDYRKYFDASDTPRPAGIAVLTDADDTRSRAQGDYAGFRACAS